MTDIDEQLQQLCERTAEIVAEAQLPEPLHAVAFGRVFDALIAEAVPTVLPGGPAPDAALNSSTHGSGLAAIARKADVPAERVEEVFSLTDNDLSVVVSSSRIDRSNAQGSRELTLLSAGGRQAAGMEDWTALGVTRDVCSNYARFDSGNYASSIKAMDNLISFRGQGANREIRLTMPGWDAWKELVQQALDLR